jgi:parallel beta-helix repeat protein
VNFLTSNIGATSADLVTYTPSGTSAVARSAASKFGDVVSVKDFGAVGNGVANDTVAIQAALNSGATSVYLPSGTYKISQVIVPNGIRCLAWTDGVIKGLGTGSDVQPLIVLGSMSGVGAITTPLTIAMNVDMSAGDRCAIGGHSVTNCTISNTSIYGFVDTASVVNGLYFLAGCNNNIVTDSNIVGVSNPSGTVNLIHFTANPPTFDGGYLTASGVVSQPPAPATGNIICNNVLRNGRYAVVLQGSYRCVVANNYCHNQDARCIYLGNAAWQNTISDNLCSEYVSSAIHLAYGASFNIVANNRCVRNSAYANGESAIQAYLGTTDNQITGNHIHAGTNFGIYIGPDAHRNVVENNRISGFQRAAIMVENDWISPLPANNSISRPNYEAPFLGAPSWSFNTLDTCIIKSNTIGAGLVGTAVGIGFAQIDSLGSTALANVKIDGNHFMDLGLAFGIFGYYMTQAKLTGLVITGNRNNPGELFRLANPTTFPQWGPVVEYYGENNTFDQIVNQELITFANGDTTPSVKTNSSLPNRRVYQCNNSAPTTITDFDDGIAIQTITIRLDVNTTIQHNSGLIRCKGGVNVTGVTSNDFITFIDLGGGIWFETWRSF